MGRYGRPKLSDVERRDAMSLNVRFNEREKAIVEEKAREAGVTTTEWARLATLERNPPPRRVIPEFNREAWLELSTLAATLNGAICRFQPGDERELYNVFESLRRQLGSIRNQLVGNDRGGE